MWQIEHQKHTNEKGVRPHTCIEVGSFAFNFFRRVHNLPVSDILVVCYPEGDVIPPLQRGDETWALTPEEKAAELASVFKSKSRLPDAVCNNDSPLTHEAPARMLRIPILKVTTVYNLLRALDDTSGTGPDRLPTRILKLCAAELSLPVMLLSRKWNGPLA